MGLSCSWEHLQVGAVFDSSAVLRHKCCKGTHHAGPCVVANCELQLWQISRRLAQLACSWRPDASAFVATQSCLCGKQAFRGVEAARDVQHVAPTEVFTPANAHCNTHPSLEQAANGLGRDLHEGLKNVKPLCCTCREQAARDVDAIRTQASADVERVRSQLSAELEALREAKFVETERVRAEKHAEVEAVRLERSAELEALRAQRTTDMEDAR